MKNDAKKNKGERDLIALLEKGKLKRTRNADQEMKIAKKAADQYLKKNSRINIRLSGTDLTLLKRKAAQEGMPYQTLIASVLHKFAAGG